jgi:hypothetical protein
VRDRLFWAGWVARWWWLRFTRWSAIPAPLLIPFAAAGVASAVLIVILVATHHH